MGSPQFISKRIATMNRRGSSGTGVSPVRFGSHRRDARATTRFMESSLFQLDVLTAHEPNYLPKIWDDQRFQLTNL